MIPGGKWQARLVYDNGEIEVTPIICWTEVEGLPVAWCAIGDQVCRVDQLGELNRYERVERERQ